MRNSGSCMDLEAAQGLHRRDAAGHQQAPRNGGGGRRRAQDGRLAGRARWLVSARWRLVVLLLLGLTVRARVPRCGGAAGAPWWLLGAPCRPTAANRWRGSGAAAGRPRSRPRTQPYHASLRLPRPQLHSLTAKTTAPLFGSRGGIAGGVRVDGALPTGEGGQGGRARSLVEQPASPREGALTVLAAKAADLMAPLARVGAPAPPPPPPHEIPKEWLEVRGTLAASGSQAGCRLSAERLHWAQGTLGACCHVQLCSWLWKAGGRLVAPRSLHVVAFPHGNMRPAAPLQGGTLGMWPKPYRNKTRQVMPNSVHEWKCSPEAANFTAAASSSAPVLQSCELEQPGVAAVPGC